METVWTFDAISTFIGGVIGLFIIIIIFMIVILKVKIPMPYFIKRIYLSLSNCDGMCKNCPVDLKKYCQEIKLENTSDAIRKLESKNNRS
jgi:hypothetical protein